MASEMPESRVAYSPGVLRDLTKALNAVLPMFSTTIEMIEVPQGDVRVLPPEMVRYLAMVQQAATDYGLQLMPLDKLRTEDALTALAGQLLALAKDENFRDYLDANEEMAEEEGEEMGEEEGEGDCK